MNQADAANRSPSLPPVEPVYHELKKIDAHIHLNVPRTILQDTALAENFSLVSINTEVPEFPGPEEQRETTFECSQNIPGTLAFIATFSLDGWGEDNWADRAIEQIEKGVGRGAVAVKIWKNIGMELQSENGEFVMADHPSFRPVLDFLEKRTIPLLAHLGEPRNCWLPLEEMTVTSDRDYFSRHPQYHMYYRKDTPSYREQLQARDRMLQKHPNLRFVAAHLASLEWDVHELASWLDRFPRCGVDLAERVCHLQHQASENHAAVRQFIENYQDRIIFGTDQIENGTMAGDELRETIRQKWRREFQFFAGSGVQTAWNVQKPFRGLGLQKKTLEKIFRDNSLFYYSRLRDHLKTGT